MAWYERALELLAKATPRPWRIGTQTWIDLPHEGRVFKREIGRDMARVLSHRGQRPLRDEDASLITEAPDLLEAAIAERDQLRADLEKARAELAKERAIPTLNVYGVQESHRADKAEADLAAARAEVERLREPLTQNPYHPPKRDDPHAWVAWGEGYRAGWLAPDGPHRRPAPPDPDLLAALEAAERHMNFHVGAFDTKGQAALDLVRAELAKLRSKL